MTSKQNGFSLIEVMIAIFVLVVGVIGLTRMQSYFDKESEYAVHAVKALRFIEEDFEKIARRGAIGETEFIDISDDNPPVMTDSVYTLEREVSCYRMNATLNKVESTTCPAGGVPSVVDLKQVTATVSWLKRDGEQDSISLKTMISRYSEFE
ncbi:prepilin-type N-terminal cleavage/methylation domain-containing protein [Parasalinivibrio latis]|uniref:type IV pilus modification PilV family protein n=1 Tax=Parasalinivibrio latis TaxID=2952610 RepID=UPI0030DE91F6